MASTLELVPSTSGDPPRSRRNSQDDTTMHDVEDFARLNHRSIPWHAIFTVLLTPQLVIFQVNSQGSSPLQTHPANMWTFMVSCFIYACALGYSIKLQTSTQPDSSYQELFSNTAALISGSLSYAALTSVLVPHSIEPLVFIIWLIFLFLYFARNPIMSTSKNIVSCVNNKWKRITEINDDPATIIAP